jgi:group I intron endonuclease
MHYTIYKFTNRANGKVYIGKTSTTPEKRALTHLKASKAKSPACIFHKAIKKYGFDQFEQTVLASTTSSVEINDLETMFIKQFDCCVLDSPDKGYNMTRGGDGFDSDVVRRNNLLRVADGTHPWAGERGSKLNTATQIKRVKAGTHHWVGEAGSAFASAEMKRRVENGTNAWAGELGSAHSKRVAAKCLEEGRHHSQKKLTCSHCGKVGAGNAMAKWHFARCRLIASSQSQPESLV